MTTHCKLIWHNTTGEPVFISYFVTRESAEEYIKKIYPLYVVSEENNNRWIGPGGFFLLEPIYESNEDEK